MWLFYWDELKLIFHTCTECYKTANTKLAIALNTVKEEDVDARRCSESRLPPQAVVHHLFKKQLPHLPSLAKCTHEHLNLSPLIPLLGVEEEIRKLRLSYGRIGHSGRINEDIKTGSLSMVTLVSELHGPYLLWSSVKGHPNPACCLVISLQSVRNFVYHAASKVSDVLGYLGS